MLQVLLVTGGQDGQILDSTEILEMKENSVWKMSAPLPSPRLGLRAATVGNSLHVFGKTLEYTRHVCFEYTRHMCFEYRKHECFEYWRHVSFE